MSDSTDKKTGGDAANPCGSNCDYTLAFWVLRLWLAVRALLTGIEKFGGYKSVQVPVIDPKTGQPDPDQVVELKLKFYALANYSGIPSTLKGKFANEWLPPFATAAFDKVLGPLLIVTGLMLLVGFATRASLFIMGLIYIALTVGLILIHQDDGISWLGIHVALVALALMLVKHNKFSLLKKW